MSPPPAAADGAARDTATDRRQARSSREPRDAPVAGLIHCLWLIGCGTEHLWFTPLWFDLCLPLFPGLAPLPLFLSISLSHTLTDTACGRPAPPPLQYGAAARPPARMTDRCWPAAAPQPPRDPAVRAAAPLLMASYRFILWTRQTTKTWPGRAAWPRVGAALGGRGRSRSVGLVPAERRCRLRRKAPPAPAPAPARGPPAGAGVLVVWAREPPRWPPGCFRFGLAPV